MSKIIPKQLKKAVMKCLVDNPMGPLTASNISERIENDPSLPGSMKRPPRQFTYTMKQIAREIGIVETHVLSTNGLSRHGTQRYRVGYALPNQTTLAEAVEAAGVKDKPAEYDSRMVTIRVKKDAIAYLEGVGYEDEDGTRMLNIEEIVESIIANAIKADPDAKHSHL
jgi:hypothetical protein